MVLQSAVLFDWVTCQNKRMKWRIKKVSACGISMIVEHERYENCFVAKVILEWKCETMFIS